MRNKKVSVIGGGFSGLAAAAVLGKEGFDVNLFEKNEQLGGRARVFQQEGFVFDMGPSWYWMPDVFENYFSLFNKSAKDFYELKKLSPSFRIFFGKEDFMDVPSSVDDIYQIFESIEEGAALQLKKFLRDAEQKYRVAIQDRLVYKPSLSWTEYAGLIWKKDAWQLRLFSSFSSHVKKYFHHPRLRMLMEFPVLFLGAMPENTPALFSLMNYAGLSLGTWYPMGGMYKIVEAMESLAKSNGVRIHSGAEVKNIQCNHRTVTGCEFNGEMISADAIIASADYHHVERALLPQNHRAYSNSYWEKKTMAPSSLIFFLGVNKKLKNLLHHNLFFDEDFSKHAREIYADPKWPSSPQFYVSCPSQTDPSVAPEGKENLFILTPIASGLNDSEELREKYFNLVIERLERITGNDLKNDIEVKKSYCLNDFASDYHAFKGNAYGLANTFFQTAFMRPRMQSRSLKNLFYAGQLTVPGPGVPPSIISGQIAANLVSRYLN